jgi:hypothetical protein
LRSLADAVSGLAARLDGGQAVPLADALVQAMTRTTDPAALAGLADAVSALAARLDGRRAGKLCADAAAALVNAMTRTTDSRALRSLADAVSGLAARLDGGQAALLAAALVQAMSRTTDPAALAGLADAVSALASRLDGGQAGKVCVGAATALVRAMSKTTDPGELNRLAESTVVALTGFPPTRNASTAATVVAVLVDRGSWPTTLAVLSLVQSPPPCRLSTPQLVDLLRHPLCVGQARRLVLDQLEIRYNRTFADQWDFVRFATDELHLDLSETPSR